MKGTRINPLIIVRDINRSIAFYESILGLKKNVVLEEEGKIRYVDFIVGSSVLMVVPESSRPGDVQNKLQTGVKGLGVELYFDIDEDIKELYAKLKSNGLVFTKELFVTPWNTYQFQFGDPDGYIFIVSKPLPLLS